jgi:hypothetical protein
MLSDLQIYILTMYACLYVLAMMYVWTKLVWTMDPMTTKMIEPPLQRLIDNHESSRFSE